MSVHLSSSFVLEVVHADDLIDPSNERADLDIDAGHVLPAAAEAPRNQACQLVVALVLANQRSATIALRHKENKATRCCHRLMNQ